MGDQKKPTSRGVDLSKQKVWVDAIAKENRLRLKWFRKNEAALRAITTRENIMTVPQSVKDEFKQNRINKYQNVKRHFVARDTDPKPMLIPEDAIFNVMKPVDPETKKLLYIGTQKDGRTNYLRQRYHLRPEDKFYFPENVNAVYGWKMWDSSKESQGTRYGRTQIIKDSFYRRAGVQRDPDWYQEPAKLTPNVCGSI